MKLAMSDPGRPGKTGGHMKTALNTAVTAAATTITTAGLLFITTAPVVDGIFTATAQTGQIQKENASYNAYNPQTDPLEANEAIKGIAKRIVDSAPDTRGRLAALFSMLNTSSATGVKVVASEGRPPNTAAETLAKGGDCTEFASVVLAVINAMNSKGAGINTEAQIAHFTGSPESKQHMIVTAEIDGKKTIIDLQSTALGTTKRGNYAVVRILASEEAAAMYHQEWADYFSDRKTYQDAVAAYKRSLAIYATNPDANKGAAANYDRMGSQDSALAYYRHATALDPQYGRDTLRVKYYMAYSDAEKKAGAGEWREAAAIFRNALGVLDMHPFRKADIEATERNNVNTNIRICEKNAGVAGQ